MNTLIHRIDFDSLRLDTWTSAEMENARFVIGFMQKLWNEHDFDYVAETYKSSAYKQHNRIAEDGIPGLVKLNTLWIGQNPEYSVDVKRIYVDGEFVITHSHATLKKEHRGNDSHGLNIIDIWWVQDGNKIAEHWDAIQPLDDRMRSLFAAMDAEARNSNGIF